MYYIYLRRDEETGKSYVGYTKDFKRRKYEHSKNHDVLHETILLEIAEDRKIAQQLEKFYIDELLTSVENGGYNISYGVSRPQTEEEKQKRSKSLSGRKFTEEHRKHISECRKGLKLSDEHKKAISNGVNKAFEDENIRNKHVEALRKNWKSEERRQKQSEAIKKIYAENPDHKYKTVTNNKEIVMIDTIKNETKNFFSISEAATYLNVKNHVGIRRALRTGKTYKEKYFKYKHEDKESVETIESTLKNGSE